MLTKCFTLFGYKTAPAPDLLVCIDQALVMAFLQAGQTMLDILEMHISTMQSAASKIKEVK
jgi:hypothetical protein